MRRPVRAVVAGVTLATAASLALTGQTTATADGGTLSDRLQDAVTFKGVKQHLRAFQRIADNNGGNRAAGLPGYDASADYVARHMRQAGYQVRMQPFEFPFFLETGDPTLRQISPDPTTYEETEDFITMTLSGSDDVTGRVQGVDLAFDDPESSTSGCSRSDFRGFQAGRIALIQRGTCTFGRKANLAEEAGAVGVIIFNQGNDPTRLDAFAGTLGGLVVDIPVVGASFALGQDLANPANTRVRMVVEAISEIRVTHNVIAQTPGGDANDVVMLGAHLDSVPEGAGINDNGSGSGALLEIARQMTEVGAQPRNKVRFAWWGAEELGLVGSNYYVATLPQNQLEDIELYLNFDMIGSPNFIFGVYDGDGSEFGLEGPEGSDEIEAMFRRFYKQRGTEHQATEFSGRSDYAAFINAGIASGGLFTGADGIKTRAEERRYRGVSGAIHDPCYHAACDTMTPVLDGADRTIYAELYDENGLRGNVAPRALHINADAIAHAVAKYSRDISEITRGRPSPDRGSLRATELEAAGR